MEKQSQWIWGRGEMAIIKKKKATLIKHHFCPLARSRGGRNCMEHLCHNLPSQTQEEREEKVGW
jgi:hypothetical protein